jgi:hypothetical protein
VRTVEGSFVANPGVTHETLSFAMRFKWSYTPITSVLLIVLSCMPWALHGSQGIRSAAANRNVPSANGEQCPDGDLAVGPAPTSVGSGFGDYYCHPANTWTYYPRSTAVTSFTN